MNFKTHVIIGLLICSVLSFFGSKAQVLQASLNLQTAKTVTNAEFQDLQNQSIHINIDGNYRQTLISNLRLEHESNLIRVSSGTKVALESIFNQLKDSQNAELINKNGSLYLKPSQVGFQVNLNLLEKKLNSKKFHNTKVVDLESYKIYPSYNTSQARADMQLIKDNQNQQIKFRVDSEIAFNQSKIYSIYEFATYFQGKLVIDQEKLTALLTILKETVDKEAENIKLEQSNKEFRVGMLGKLGQKINISKSINNIQSAIDNKQASVDLEYDIIYPQVFTENGETSNWKLMSFGASDYTGSITNRVINIQMASNHVYNNTLVQPDELFSYNDLLMSKGRFIDWKNAFVIVNGKDLKEAPGGGLCQVSTTIYRAAIKAGLEIKKLKNHSLYVKYYKKHGDGLDATIFPGAQDLEFKNIYDKPILIQTYFTPNNKLIAMFYSEATPKPVELKGPFYSNNYSEFPELAVKRNEIKWIREFVESGETEIFTSSYNEPVI